VQQVKAREDCPHCGAKEEKDHHPGNCIAALKATLEKERVERKAVIDDALVAENDHIRRERDLLRVALKDIAGTTNRTATPAQFIRHLQKIAADALGGKYEG
jgi:hypothetical protein